jgi:2-polyprenyl-3-methyl-5-hydroxy-6-metoxy-1,4-benzoquinol methylase
MSLIDPQRGRRGVVGGQLRTRFGFPRAKRKSYHRVKTCQGCVIVSAPPHDKSNGYEEVAERFMQARNPRVGASTVREWSHALAPGSSILDVGCGHGVPISQVLTEEGFALYGVDASAKMVESFRKRFPNAHAECSAVEDSEFFARTFDGVVAW